MPWLFSGVKKRSAQLTDCDIGGNIGKEPLITTIIKLTMFTNPGCPFN